MRTNIALKKKKREEFNELELWSVPGNALLFPPIFKIFY